MTAIFHEIKFGTLLNSIKQILEKLFSILNFNSKANLGVVNVGQY